jgi:hypothetical protein
MRTHLCVEARPGERDRSADERRIAGRFGVVVVQNRRDAPLPQRAESRVLAQLRQRVRLAQREEQRADIAVDFGFDDGKHRRPPAVHALAPDRDGDAAAGLEHAPPFADRTLRVVHVHQSERAQHNVECCIGQVERLRIHALELHVRHLLLGGSAARDFDHLA